MYRSPKRHSLVFKGLNFDIKYIVNMNTEIPDFIYIYKKYLDKTIYLSIMELPVMI